MSLLKDRLDEILVKKGFFESRQRAKASIMAGIVFVDGKLCDKAGTKFSEDADFFVKRNLCSYVSRGGLKLEKAIFSFYINLQDKICMDIGASTGGFTDCMLQNGAKKVYAIDVGRGQLDYKLQIDERVVNIERTNVRYFDDPALEKQMDFISVDVSFISLNLILPVVKKMLKAGGEAVCLVKPQFEAGREQVGNKGIVKDAKIHKEVIKKAMKYAENHSLQVINLDHSPLTGAKGNIEFLLHIRNTEKELEEIVLEDKIEDIVKTAHEALNV